jgi:hypothetical protein
MNAIYRIRAALARFIAPKGSVRVVEVADPAEVRIIVQDEPASLVRSAARRKITP